MKYDQKKTLEQLKRQSEKRAKKPAKELLKITKNIDYSKYPNIAFFNDITRIILYAMLIGTKETQYKNLTPREIAYILELKFSYKYKKTTLKYTQIDMVLKNNIGVFVDKHERENTQIAYSITDTGIQFLDYAIKELKAVDKSSIDKIFFLPVVIFEKSKNYVKSTVFQINGCYSRGYFDACASMIRKLIETLIVEIYEAKEIESKLKNNNRVYYQLKKILNIVAGTNDLNLSKPSVDLLKDAKFLGDIGSHNRLADVKKIYLDEIKNPLRVIIDELVKKLKNS